MYNCSFIITPAPAIATATATITTTITATITTTAAAVTTAATSSSGGFWTLDAGGFALGAFTLLVAQLGWAPRKGGGGAPIEGKEAPSRSRRETAEPRWNFQFWRKKKAADKTSITPPPLQLAGLSLPPELDAAEATARWAEWSFTLAVNILHYRILAMLLPIENITVCLFNSSDQGGRREHSIGKDGDGSTTPHWSSRLNTCTR
ncbi:hypothetical protein B7463_g147, partial [Scytalidium lignicola]